MQVNLAGKNQYKLISVLREGVGFHAYEALDIEVSGREPVLLNVYESGPATRAMVAILYGVSASVCADHRGCFTEAGRFSAVFRYYEGEEFARFFDKRHALEPQERLAFAHSLMHAILENAALPEQIQCRALRADNLVVEKNFQSIRFNFILAPDAAAQSPSALTAPLLEQILLRRWFACDEQIDFLDRLVENPFPTIGAMYSAWRAAAEIIAEDLDKRRNLIAQLFRFLRRSFRRWKRKRARNKKRPSSL